MTLLHAIETNDIPLLKQVLKGEDLDKPFTTTGWANGRTPLQYAAHKQHVESMVCLLEAGASPNAEGKLGWTAAEDILTFGRNKLTHTDRAMIFSLCIEKGAQSGQCETYALLKELFLHGPDNIILTSVIQKHSDWLKKEINASPLNLFYLFCPEEFDHPNTKIILQFLEASPSQMAKIDSSQNTLLDRTPLQNALYYGAWSYAKWLIQVKNCQSHKLISKKQNAIGLALSSNISGEHKNHVDPSIIQLLLQQGVNINHPPKNEILSHALLTGNFHEIITLLQQNGLQLTEHAFFQIGFNRQMQLIEFTLGDICHLIKATLLTTKNSGVEGDDDHEILQSHNRWIFLDTAFEKNLNISNLCKSELLVKLYHTATVNPLFSHSRTMLNDFTAENAEKLLKINSYIDSINGRVIKINFEGPTIDPTAYNHANGVGAAQKVMKDMSHPALESMAKLSLS